MRGLIILWCLTPQQYFSYIVVVSFIGGGNRSIQRKPPTCRKSLTALSHTVVSSTPKILCTMESFK